MAVGMIVAALTAASAAATAAVACAVEAPLVEAPLAGVLPGLDDPDELELAELHAARASTADARAAPASFLYFTRFPLSWQTSAWWVAASPSGEALSPFGLSRGYARP
jgi:hypothetical protein